MTASPGTRMKRPGRLKRGGGATTVPLDFTTAEGEVREIALAADVDLDAWFQHEFVRALFARAVDALRADYLRPRPRAIT